MSNVLAVMPEIVVTVVATLVLLVDTMLPRRAERGWLALLTVAGLLVALVSGPFVTVPGTAFNGFVQIDTFTTFSRVVFIVLAIFAVLVAPGYLARHDIPAGEYYAIVLFSTVGAMTIALSNDLITLSSASSSCPSRCTRSPGCSATTAIRTRRHSSTSSSARSARPCCCTGSPGCTG